MCKWHWIETAIIRKWKVIKLPLKNVPYIVVTIEMPFIEYLYNAATFSNGNGREKIWLGGLQMWSFTWSS